MACTFCATGTMGLLGNLHAGEILEQLIHANRIEKIRNVVFMGMGEPLDNYKSVLLAIKAMVDPARFCLSPTRVSISTVGVIPRLRQLAVDAPEVGLALSLHAPNQELRKKIVPTGKAWPIEDIVDAAEAFAQGQQNAHKERNVMVEYVMIDEVNDRPQHAHELGALLAGKHMVLNLIPYNPTNVPFPYRPPKRAAVEEFVKIVREEHGVKVIIRQKLGDDISSACGQLVVENPGEEAMPGAGKVCASSDNLVQDIEDVVGGAGGDVAPDDQIRSSRAGAKRITRANRRQAAIEKVAAQKSGGSKKDSSVSVPPRKSRWPGLSSAKGRGNLLLAGIAVALAVHVGWRIARIFGWSSSS